VAELYRAQIEAGLGGDAQAAQKGRAVLLGLLGGPVKLTFTCSSRRK
jgi:hypothetical protein